MGCDQSRVKELELENEKLGIKVEALGHRNEELATLRQKMIQEESKDIQRARTAEGYTGDVNDASAARAYNMEHDPLANISLGVEEQAKVNKIIVDNLKYLNKEEHATDKKVVEDMFKDLDLDHNDSVSKAEFEGRYGKKQDHMWNLFDLDGNGELSLGEFLAVIDAKYDKDPTAAAKYVKFLSMPKRVPKNAAK